MTPLPDPAVQTFIIHWLNPKMRLLRPMEDGWAHLLADCALVKDHWPVIADLIQRMDYSHDFVDTGYWKIISSEVQRRAGFVCQRCGRKRCKLETHHLTYANHGNEHVYMQDLQALCLPCHLLEHAEVIKAVLAQWCAQRSAQLACLGDDIKLTEAGFRAVDDQSFGIE